MTTDADPAVCPKCGHSAERCMYCKGIPLEDWEAICDCGLADFGAHLISCDITHEPQ